MRGDDITMRDSTIFSVLQLIPKVNPSFNLPKDYEDVGNTMRYYI